MLALKTNRYRYRGWGGANEILDEDWDELFVPALVTSTPWEQWEGTGRNNFGTMIIERPWRWQRPASSPPHPLVRPSLPESAPKPLQHNYQDIVPTPTGPRQEESAKYLAWRRALVERVWERKRLSPKGVEPLHVFCMNCGYRQGGPDSWDGQTCKCGTRSEPLRGAGGGYFYGMQVPP
jgi:hypothetical protein